MSQSPLWVATARLLRRTGFGTTGPQVDAVLRQDISTYLDAALDLDPEGDPGAVATPMPSSSTMLPPPRGARASDVAAFGQAVLGQMRDLEYWWLRRMVEVRQPIHEKLTLLWHNHFATSVEKVGSAEHMALQNQKLRTLKLGDFRALAYAMLTDAAMQQWLDGVRNTKAAPNENLSREFMELFTLGHGSGYTENDVREGARALTGRYIGFGGTTTVAAENHDSTTKTVLGVTGNLDDRAFCDAVLGQPSSARFVAGKLWQLLASDAPPPSATLDRLVAAYGRDRNLKALTKAILVDPEFAAAVGTVVNTPVEWLVGVVRSLSVPLSDPQTIAAMNAVLAVMGQRPFHPPDVSGWPRGAVWLSTTSTAARVWALDAFLPMGDLSPVEDTGPADRIDATGYLIGIGIWSDRTVAALKPFIRDPLRLVTAALNTPEYLTS